MPEPGRGRYLALEGIEGAGKSTVASHVAPLLEERGIDVITVREPGGTSAGESIREILLDPGGTLAPWSEALLFAAARAQIAAEVVAPALDAGRWVISDRSVYSSLAYQGAGRGLGVREVRTVNEAGLGGVWPDLVVLLRIDAGSGLARQEVADRIGAEGPEFQGRVAVAFDELAAQEPHRFAVVDATGSVSQVVAGVMAAIDGAA